MWCLRDHCGALSSVFHDHFPSCSVFTTDEDSAKTDPYCVVSEAQVFGLFVPLPPAVLIGSTQETNISLEAGVGQIVFFSAVFVGFQSRYQSTLIPVPPSIKPM